MRFRLKTAGFFIYILFLIFTAGIVSAATAGCFTGKTEAAATEPMAEETTSQNEQSGKDPEPAQTSGEDGVQNSLPDLIVVENPVPGQVIASPLTVSGKARGTWYFEADFPVYLLDANGNILVSHYGQAQGEWMTEDFVPFLAEIVFENPTTETGTLVLEKNNPSGLEENNAKIEIPVRFEVDSAD